MDQLSVTRSTVHHWMVRNGVSEVVHNNNRSTAPLALNQIHILDASRTGVTSNTGITAIHAATSDTDGGIIRKGSLQNGSDDNLQNGPFAKIMPSWLA